jgi:hypothetical protein
MVSKESVSNQRICIDLLNDHPRHLRSDWAFLRKHKQQRTLDDWCAHVKKTVPAECLSMPRCLNWKKMHEIYDVQPKNYEEFIAFQGVGASTVRALALIAELIYGEKPSWRDPVKYSYVHGGKVGKTYHARLTHPPCVVGRKSNIFPDPEKQLGQQGLSDGDDMAQA